MQLLNQKWFNILTDHWIIARQAFVLPFNAQCGSCKDMEKVETVLHLL